MCRLALEMFASGLADDGASGRWTTVLASRRAACWRRCAVATAIAPTPSAALARSFATPRSSTRSASHGPHSQSIDCEGVWRYSARVTAHEPHGGRERLTLVDEDELIHAARPIAGKARIHVQQRTLVRCGPVRHLAVTGWRRVTRTHARCHVRAKSLTRRESQLCVSDFSSGSDTLSLCGEVSHH
jgi:hypothetical protein